MLLWEGKIDSGERESDSGLRATNTVATYADVTNYVKLHYDCPVKTCWIARVN